MGNNKSAEYYKGLGFGELESKAMSGDKKAIAKMKKQKNMVKRRSKFDNTIRARENLTDDQKMKIMDYVGENIFTEKEVKLNKGGSVKRMNNGGAVMPGRGGKFKGIS